MNLKKNLAWLLVAALTLHAPHVSAALQTRPEMPEFLNISEWINAREPVSRQSLAGSVVLVDFFNPNLVESLQKVPFLTAMQQKYRPFGFRVVALLSPENDFDLEKEHLLKVAKKLGVNFPIGLDSQRTMWQAYNNLAPSVHYLIDATGRIMSVHYPGESFESQEKKIQELLLRAGEEFEEEFSKFDPPAIIPAQTIVLASNKSTQLGNIGRLRSETPQAFKIPEITRPGDFYLDGQWKIGEKFFESTKPSSALELIWDGRPLYLLAGSSFDAPIPAEILVDGAPLDKKKKGRQVVMERKKSYVFIHDAELYQLTKRLPAGNHRLRIQIQESGARVYKIIFEG